MKKISQIKLMISCPNDIKDEIDSINLIVDEINKSSGKHSEYAIQIVTWKYDTYTDVASDGQEVINNQLEDEYDILVGLLWLRAGTPTKRYDSGTIEEINLALLKNDTFPLIYFKTAPPDNIYNIDHNQFEIIKKFKSELIVDGVLYKDYNSIDVFESMFRINLINLINDKILKNKDVNVISLELEVKKTESKYSNVVAIINKIEQKDESSLNIDVFELFEKPKIYLENVTISLNSMSNSLNFLTERMNTRKNEIDKVNFIKDTKLKNNKALVIINNLANEFDEFNLRIQNEIVFFSENFKLVGKSYAEILLIFADDNSNDVILLKKELIKFRDSVSFAMNNQVNLLEVMLTLPLMNYKFNKSKRNTELVMKDIAKELYEGILLLDEAIGD